MYVKEKHIHQRVMEANKCAALFHDLLIVLDVPKPAEYWLLPTGEWCQKIWGKLSLQHARGSLIFRFYWYELIHVCCIWSKIMLPPEGNNPSFENECSQLSTVNIPGHLVDVVGDENCLYYCMLHFVFECGNPQVLSIKREYPLSGYAKLNYIYDPTINYMDGVFICGPGNVVEYQGDQVDMPIYCRFLQSKSHNLLCL
jgi:hypothetical protein